MRLQLTDDQKAAIAKYLPLALTAGRDLVGLVGIVMIIHGVDLIYTPAAWILGGALFILATFALRKRD